MEKIELSKREENFVQQLDKTMLEKIMTPRNDLVFKKLFGAVGRENIVKDFLEAILNLKIDTVELGKEK